MMDWTKADPDLVRTIVKQGEVFLCAQLSLATSADQRASTMASIFAAAGAAVLGVLVAAAASSTVDAGAIVWAGAIVGGMFVVASALCVWATLPSNFELAGNEPSSYEEEISKGIPEIQALISEAQNYQTKIERNDETLRKNATKFQIGAIIGVMAPFVGGAVWASSSLC